MKFYPIKLLDNLRFNSGEEANDPQFIEQLVAGQDFCQRCTGASHQVMHQFRTTSTAPECRWPATQNEGNFA